MDLTRVGERADVWEKVVRKLRAGAMPPAGRPRPDQNAIDGLTSWLERELDRAAATNPNPGAAQAVHRLNRAEYVNAIRDLLAIEIDGRSLLPADVSGYGFDNIADVLLVSPGPSRTIHVSGNEDQSPRHWESHYPVNHRDVQGLQELAAK